MPTIVWPGTPGEKFDNDSDKILYQLICSWSNTCGQCAQYHLAVAKWWGKFHHGCLLPGSTIVPDAIRAAFVARYDGDAYRITFGDGTTTSVTANHMLLTPRGFCKAEDIVQGGQVIQCPSFQGVVLDNPYEDRCPAPIEEVIRSLAMRPGVVSRPVPASSEDLHGDGRFCYGDVHVITADGQLLDDFDPRAGESSQEISFHRADYGLKILPPAGDPQTILLALRDATDGGDGGLREAKAAFLSELLMPERCGFALVPDRDSIVGQDFSDRRTAASYADGHPEFAQPGCVEVDDFGPMWRLATGRGKFALAVGPYHRPGLEQSIADHLGGDPERIRNAGQRFPGEVTTLDIIRVERVHYVGPIYDVQTTSSLYLLGNGVASSNCNCRSEPVFPGKAGKPYEDWHDIVDNLPPDQQKKLVGASNFALIDKGVVEWGDVVTSTRVRLLREVVSRSKLTIDQMTKAGVQEPIAIKAHQSVNTPEHILAQQHRQQLVQQMQDLGVRPKTIKDMLAGELTGRIGLGGSRGGQGSGMGVPGVGPQPMPRTGPTREGWIRRVMGMLSRLFRSRQKASMGPTEKGES